MKSLLLSLLITLVLLGCDTKANQVSQTPKEAAIEFLTAFCNGDAKKVAEMCDIVGLRRHTKLKNEKDIRKQTEKELEQHFAEMGPLPNLKWEILEVGHRSDEKCVIRFMFKIIDQGKEASDESVLFGIKREGKWYFEHEPIF